MVRVWLVVLSVVGAMVGYVSLSGFCFGSACQPWEANDGMKYEVLELQGAANTLAHAPIPNGWAVGVFLSSESMEAVLATLRGVTAEVTSMPGTQLRITDLRVVPGTGRTRVDVELEVLRPRENLEVTFAVESYLQYRRADIGSDSKEPRAVFGLNTVKITPRARWGFLSGSTPELVSRVLGSGVARVFASSLEVDVPLMAHPQLKFGLPENAEKKHSVTKTVPTGKDGTVTLELSITESDVAPKLTPWIPLSTARGVWILASLGDTFTGVLDPALLPSSQTELRSLRDALLRTVSDGLSKVDSPRDQTGIFLSTNAMFDIVKRFNSLPESAKTLSVVSLRHSGALVNKMQNVAGSEGGFRVDLKGGQAIHATLKSGDASPSWDPLKGLTLSIPLKAHADADVILEVDPFIGGGITTGTTITGNAGPQEYEETLILERQPTMRGDVVLFGSAPTCKRVELELLAGGEVEFGARTYENVGGDLRPATVLVDPLPRYQPISRLIGSEGRSGLTVKDTWIERTVTLKELRATQNGYWLTISPAFRRVTSLPDENALEVARIEMLAASQAGWQSRWTPKCPDRKEMEFLFAGQAFGPDNELVKALKALANALSQQSRNVEVAWSDISKVAKDPTKAPEVAGDLVKRSARVVEKALGQTVDLAEGGAKELGKLGKSATKTGEKILKKLDPSNW